MSVVDILYLHFRLIEDYGGSHGIRDEGRVKSVVEAPMMLVFGAEQYETLYEKAAVYVRNIVGDHPFIDGNKRSAVTAGAVFMLRNGYIITASSDALENFAVRVAVEHLEISVIAAWLKAHSKKAKAYNKIDKK